MPNWLDNIVFYEVYPQSFMDTNADGIGDIQGIIRKLDYIKELGCDGVWLNPCYESPFFDAGYDVSNYKKVAPRYGTNEDLKELFEKAHEKEMKVILDLVPGHTSISHAWFQESCKAVENEFTSRYVWNDDIWKDFKGVEGVSGSIRGFYDRNGSCAVNFFSIQPALNYGFMECKEEWQQPMDAPGPMATREAIKDVMRFFMSMGCDGFRIDMAGAMVKNDKEQEGTIALWQDFRKFMEKEYPECVMISEWGDPERSLRGGFHMDFLLHFGPSHYLELFREENPYFAKEGKGDVAAFVSKYKEYYAATNGKGLICIPSGNHDMARIKDKLGEEELKIAFAFLLSMPGAPFLYYGDEIGMNYIHDMTSVEGGFHRTGARTPMQWDETANAGFSSCEPEDLYLAIDKEKNHPTVAKAKADPNSLYNEIKKLMKLRKEHKALQNIAPIVYVYAEKESYPFIYKRIAETEEILVILNPKGEEAVCKIPIQEQGNIIYSYHGEAQIKEGIVTVPAASTTYIAYQR